MKIGMGYDIHRLVDGRDLFLGGVKIPFEKGLRGHSDADVLLHAICDAILGAMAEDNIGELFPDTDPEYKDADSKALLGKVKEIMDKRGFKVGNIDCVIIAEEPKITPFRDKIKETISGILGVSSGRLSMKGKTNEGVGALGRSEAIAAQAIVLLEEVKDQRGMK